MQVSLLFGFGLFGGRGCALIAAHHLPSDSFHIKSVFVYMCVNQLINKLDWYTEVSYSRHVMHIFVFLCGRTAAIRLEA